MCVTNGACVAVFTQVNTTINERYDCYSISELMLFDVCSGLLDTDVTKYMCCHEDDCNRDFIGSNPFTTPSPPGEAHIHSIIHALVEKSDKLFLHVTKPDYISPLHVGLLESVHQYPPNKLHPHHCR